MSPSAELSRVTAALHHAAEDIAAAYAQLDDSAAAVAWLRRTASEGMPC